MGLIDWFKSQETAVQVIVGGGVLVAGGVIALVVLVILAAVVGTFVLDAGSSVEAGVQAGASVSFEESTGSGSPGAVTVVYTSNQNAEYLRVEWEATNGDVTSPETRRLTQLGDELVIEEASTESDTEVSVTVTAVGQDGEETVVVERTDTI